MATSQSVSAEFAQNVSEATNEKLLQYYSQLQFENADLGKTNELAFVSEEMLKRMN